MIDVQLSAHFTVGEFEKSQTALRLAIDNTPPNTCIYDLKMLCEHCLEPIRAYIKRPLYISSGYRSVALCKAIGSKPSSQHALGQAVDFEVAGIDNNILAMWVDANLDYDQLILEYYDGACPNSGWLHLSFNSTHNRNEFLTFDGAKYRRYNDA